MDLGDVGEVTSQNASKDCLLFVKGGSKLVNLLGRCLAEFELHLLLGVLEPIETLDLGQELVVDLQGLLHGSVAELVFPTDTFFVVCVGMVKTEEEVYESQEISLLCSYFFLSLENAKTVAREEFALDIQHAD